MKLLRSIAIALCLPLVGLSHSFAENRSAAKSPTIDAALVVDLAVQRAERVKSIDASVSAVVADIRSRDLLLAPVLEAEGGLARDRRALTGSGGELGSRGNSATASAVLRKPFSSGTEASLSVTQDIRDTRNGLRTGAVFDWEVKLSQSLWRDRFGRATDLRYQSERFELEARLLTLLAERQTYLREVEDRYWEYVLTNKELQIRRENVERSGELVRWMKERLARFAAEDVDLVQVQALQSQRELEFQLAGNTRAQALSALEAKVPEIGALVAQAKPQLAEVSRAPQQLLFERVTSEHLAQPTRISAVAAWYDSQRLQMTAARVSDELLPSLDAYVAYGGNGTDNQLGESWSDSVDEDRNVARAGVVVSTELDRYLKEDRRLAAQYQAQASQLAAQAQLRESAASWSDVERDWQSLKRQVEQARLLAELQQRKVTTEQQRFEQGKTTTFQLTTFEIEAAESKVRYFRLLADLRKCENRAREYLRGAS